MKVNIYELEGIHNISNIKPEVPDGLAVDTGGSLYSFLNGLSTFLCVVPAHLLYMKKQEEPVLPGLSESTLLKTIAIITNKSDLSGKEINKL